MIQVPQLDFGNSNKYANIIIEDNTTTHFGGADIHVTRLAQASAIQGEILSITAPFPNSSYTLDFYGPGLQCQNVNTSAEYAWAQSLDGGGQELQLYTAWPGANFSYAFNYTDTLDYESTDSSKVFLAIQNIDAFIWDVTECSLVNVSYSVAFNFSSNTQSLVVFRQFMNGVPTYATINNMTAQAVAYQSMMFISNQLLLGTIDTGPGDSYIYQNGVLIQLTSLSQVNPLCSNLNYMFDIEEDGSCQNSSFPAVVEEYFQNMTLSLLSNQVYLYV